MTTLETLKSRYDEVQGRMKDAADRAGRSGERILLVAVTKYAEPEQVRDLIHLGHQDFGESRVQQLVQRAAMASEYLERLRTAPETAAAGDVDIEKVPSEVRWHMIGRLQRNKAKKASEHARLIHSIDSMRLAEEIQQIALKRDEPVDILLQVNCSGELSKGGVTGPAAVHVADQICTMVNVRLRGLMTMAPHTADQTEVHRTFERCRDLFEDVVKAGVCEDCFNLLSMGMSNDFETAIEHGANVVRVGSALFGGDDDGGEEDDGDD